MSLWHLANIYPDKSSEEESAATRVMFTAAAAVVVVSEMTHSQSAQSL